VLSKCKCGGERAVDGSRCTRVISSLRNPMTCNHKATCFRCGAETTVFGTTVMPPNCAPYFDLLEDAESTAEAYSQEAQPNAFNDLPFLW
jgi:hypothetical protein